MSENKDFPLYPYLSEVAEEEAGKVLETFAAKMKKLAEETILNFTSEYLPYIESDAWENFRGDLLSGLANYHNRKVQADYDFKEIRRAIYEEYRQEIIPDLDQDNLERIEELERKLKKEQDRTRSLMDDLARYR